MEGKKVSINLSVLILIIIAFIVVVVALTSLIVFVLLNNNNNNNNDNYVPNYNNSQLNNKNTNSLNNKNDIEDDNDYNEYNDGNNDDDEDYNDYDINNDDDNNEINTNEINTNDDTDNDNNNDNDNNSDNNENDNNDINGETSSKTNPLAIGKWGIASKYYSGEYVDTPARVTNVIRGAEAASQVQEYCNRPGSIYKYQEPKENMEWAVVEYDVDLTNFTKTTTVSLDRKIAGTGDNKNIVYNGTSYVVSAMNLSTDSDYGKVVSTKFAVQLPIGCSDYIIVLGSSSGTQAYFMGK